MRSKLVRIHDEALVLGQKAGGSQGFHGLSGQSRGLQLQPQGLRAPRHAWRQVGQIAQGPLGIPVVQRALCRQQARAFFSGSGAFGQAPQLDGPLQVVIAPGAVLQPVQAARRQHVCQGGEFGVQFELGRVGLDVLSLDVTQVPDVQIGDTVQLWGPQLPVEEVARAVGSDPRALLSQLTARVARRYLA